MSAKSQALEVVDSPLPKIVTQELAAAPELCVAALTMETSVGREAVARAAKEMQLLRYLIDNRGKVRLREEILAEVWEYQAGVSSRTIDVHVAWLRQKLEESPAAPKHIHTVRGTGYRFAE